MSVCVQKYVNVNVNAVNVNLRLQYLVWPLCAVMTAMFLLIFLVHQLGGFLAHSFTQNSSTLGSWWVFSHVVLPQTFCWIKVKTFHSKMLPLLFFNHSLIEKLCACASLYSVHEQNNDRKGPNHETTTTTFPTWDKVLMLERSVFLSLNRTLDPQQTADGQ